MFRNAVKLMLHRPLLDLFPDPAAEFFANAAAVSYEALEAPTSSYPVWVQRRGAPGLREALIRETGSRTHESPRWHFVQHRVGSWGELDSDTKIKLGRLLLQAGYCELLAQLLATDPLVHSDPRLDLMAVSAEVSLQRSGARSSLDAHKALARCEAAHEKLEEQARVVAALQAFLISLQYLRDETLVRRSLDRMIDHGLELERRGTLFLPMLLRSCLLRAAAMWPQQQGDFNKMSAWMSEAEELALQLPSVEPVERFLAQENLFSLYESRTRERLVRQDLQGALSFATTLVDRFPFTSTARIELAEILLRLGRAEEAAAHYEIAADHAPPGAAVAWFMAGEAHAVTGHEAAALTAWLASQRHDERAISAVRRVAGKEAGLPVLQRWCRNWLADHAPQENAA